MHIQSQRSTSKSQDSTLQLTDGIRGSRNTGKVFKRKVNQQYIDYYPARSARGKVIGSGVHVYVYIYICVCNKKKLERHLRD